MHRYLRCGFIIIIFYHYRNSTSKGLLYLSSFIMLFFFARDENNEILIVSHIIITNGSIIPSRVIESLRFLGECTSRRAEIIHKHRSRADSDAGKMWHVPGNARLGNMCEIIRNCSRRCRLNPISLPVSILAPDRLCTGAMRQCCIARARHPPPRPDYTIPYRTRARDGRG